MAQLLAASSLRIGCDRCPGNRVILDVLFVGVTRLLSSVNSGIFIICAEGRMSWLFGCLCGAGRLGRLRPRGQYRRKMRHVSAVLCHLFCLLGGRNDGRAAAATHAMPIQKRGVPFSRVACRHAIANTPSPVIWGHGVVPLHTFPARRAYREQALPTPWIPCLAAMVKARFYSNPAKYARKRR